MILPELANTFATFANAIDQTFGSFSKFLAFLRSSYLESYHARAETDEKGKQTGDDPGNGNIWKNAKNKLRSIRIYF